MILKVLQHHIDTGTPKTAGRCPIALAIEEQVTFPPGARLLGVCSDSIALCTRERVMATHIPHNRIGWVQDFDTFGPAAVAPIEIELDLPW